MQTIHLFEQRNKGKVLTDFLHGLSHLSETPLSAYHAAQGIKNGNLRCGTDRRLAAIKKAVAQFNCTVSIMNGRGDIPAIRLYSAIKQIEIWL